MRLETKKNMNNRNIVLFLLFTLFTNIKGKQIVHHVHSDTELFTSDYNMYETPPNESGDETKIIYIYFNPMTISSLSPKNMEFTLDSFLASSWVEPRYNYTVLKSWARDSYFRFPKNLVSKMWLPSMYIENCKGCADLLLSDSDHVNVYYDPIEKKTFSWIRSLFNFICHFDLHNYPFDTQTCSIKMLTYGAENKIYKFEFWPTYSQSYINVPTEFKLLEVTTNTCVNRLSPLGSTCFLYNFVLQRSTARHVWITFVPSALIVMISWISFWVDPEMVAPRVTLGLTSMLTLVTHFNAAIRDLPAEPTIMAIDIWSGSCIIHVFASIMEYAIVVYIYYHSNSNRLSSEEVLGGFRKRFFKRLFKKSTARMVDRVSQIVFPFSFGVFSLVFWTYFSLVS